MNLQITLSDCTTAACNAHPNIQAITGNLLIGNTVAGSLTAQLLFASQMRTRNGDIQMWHECQEFDACTDGAKIEKIENYLANESFGLKDRQRDVDEASVILHIEAVWLEKQFRGEQRGLWMITELVRQLEMPGDGVVMLQAGPLSRGEQTPRISLDISELLPAERKGQEEVQDSGESAHEKIARHWKKLGFDEWSDSDDAWLCVRVDEMKQSKEAEAQETMS